MRDKVVLVTGATDGIGKAAALELARMGAHVVVVGRSRPKTEATLSEIYKKSGSTALDMLLADLASINDVRRIVGEFQERYHRLDVLLNNAGGIFAQRQLSVDGYEMTFALNHLSYFLPTNLLLGLLKASAPSRIINVASDVHRFSPINFNDLQNETSYGIGGFRAYGQSKLMNVMFTYELARRLEGTGVTANALHPGSVSTSLGKNNKGVVKFFFRALHRFAASPEEGAETAVYLASSPSVEGITGKYWDRCKTIISSSDSYDENAIQQLWEISEQLTGLATPQQTPEYQSVMMQ
ncbi:MAG: SDR family oxidoreductase [Anaerolineae bacterium]|nr:SDR family oxidoreductase [Anaerolineae bacterium]